MDDMLRERYEQDSISGKTRSSGYSGFLRAFATPVDLPASYTFDMVLLADVKDYNGKNNDFPISWRESHNQFLKPILPTTRRE